MASFTESLETPAELGLSSPLGGRERSCLPLRSACRAVSILVWAACGQYQRMHICYLDDSGNSSGATLTGLIVPAAEWARTLDRWLDARREIHQEFGLPKTEELHANKLLTGRGYAEYTSLSNIRSRRSVYRIMLRSLPGGGVEVLSIGSNSTVKPHVYRCMIQELDAWACRHDTHVLVFYDGRQLGTGDQEQHEQILRDAGPYRAIHREQPISARRVVEDVITQDSRYSQLMQAADLLAYGVWHHHAEQYPDRWGDAYTAKAHGPAVAEFSKVCEAFQDSMHPLVWYPL